MVVLRMVLPSIRNLVSVLADFTVNRCLLILMLMVDQSNDRDSRAAVSIAITRIL